MHRRQQKNEYIYVIITKLTMFGIVRTETKYIIQLEESNKKTLNVFNDTGNQENPLPRTFLAKKKKEKEERLRFQNYSCNSLMLAVNLKTTPADEK